MWCAAAALPCLALFASIADAAAIFYGISVNRRHRTESGSAFAVNADMAAMSSNQFSKW
jgi:hypothetical protein